MKLLTERYHADLLGVLSCYDRMIITGTLPGACYAGGMTSFLYSRHIKIFDYAKAFADPWRERIRQCAHALADAHGVSIEHVNKPHIRKEDLVAKVIEQRGKHPGLVHVLSASVKIYDKFKRVLRVETTTNDVSFFKHHRKVEHRDGSVTRELAPLKKSIYSIIDLREILLGCNSRYLEFLSSLDDYSDGHRALHQLTEPKTDHGIQVRGFNFFDATEQDLLLAIQRPEFNIRGLRRADLRKHLPSVSSEKLSRYLKRLRILGLIKRVAKTYRYYLTRIGRAAVATCEKLTEFTIVQTLATAR